MKKQVNYRYTNRLLTFVLLLSLIFTVLSCIGAVSADSSIIYVNGSNGDDANDGFSWGTAKSSIKNATGTVSAGGTVIIADGVYTGTGNRSITITKNRTIQGQSQNGTVINAEGSGQIFVVNSGVNAIIQNLTLANGNHALYGGAIYNNRGILTLNDCTFIDNTGNLGSGAVYSSGTSTAGSLTVNNCIFTGNTGSSGAAIRNYGTPVTVNGCTFLNNTAGDMGGAIFINSGVLTVNDSTFTGNTANNKGGAIHTGQATPCTLIVNDSTFTDNTAPDGGAVYVNSGTSTITGCTFSGNTATNGGAIYSGSVISSNSTVTSSTFTGNTATGNGNAVYDNFGTSTVQFCRIIGNSGYDVYKANSGSVNANYNWWGTNADPSSRIYGNVTDGPWMVLNITTNTTDVQVGENATITAFILYDSNGVYHDPANGHVPDGIPVTFGTTLGTISPNPNYLIDGSVESTFNSNTGGTTIITASVDGVVVSTPEIEINP